MPLGYSPIASAGVGSAGSTTVLPSVDVTVGVTGMQAASALGSINARGVAKAEVTENFLVMSGWVGDVTVTGKGGVVPAGVQAIGTVGILDTIHSSNPDVTVYLKPFTMRGVVGDTAVQVRTDNVYHTISGGLHATGAVGDVVISGGVTSTYPIDVVGVEGYGRVGEVGYAQSIHVGISLPEMLMPAPVGTYALPSSFGTNLSNVQPSLWTPVKPV